jgi:hypothetical protein
VIEVAAEVAGALAAGRAVVALESSIVCQGLPWPHNLEVARAIGVPRTGWGPVMKPWGHSIPGEPWIPVDAYSKSVRRDAEEAGIPLRDPSAPRNGGLTYRTVGERGEPYPAWLRAIRGVGSVYPCSTLLTEAGSPVACVR